MDWSYFGSGHGKDIHDGAGTVLKQEIWKEHTRLDSQQLQCVVDVVTFCEWKKNEQHAAYFHA